MPPPFNIIPTPKTIYYFFRWFHNRCFGQSAKMIKEHIKSVKVDILMFNLGNINIMELWFLSLQEKNIMFKANIQNYLPIVNHCQSMTIRLNDDTIRKKQMLNALKCLWSSEADRWPAVRLMRTGLKVKIFLL